MLKAFRNILRLHQSSEQFMGIIAIVAVAAIGTAILIISHAASPYSASEAEGGILANGAVTFSDGGASGGQAVRFGNTSGGGTGAGTSKACNFFTMPSAKAAFCDDFTNETPASYSSRSGPLSPVWGISRLSNNTNASQNLYDTWAAVNLGAENDMPAPSSVCGVSGNVLPEQDMSVSCPGAKGLVETTNDGDNDVQTIWAAYPRQPFDIAGRTGTVSFDMTNNTQESEHGAWPTWVYTDQPVPTPNSFLPPEETSPSQDTANAKNSIGIDFANFCDSANNQCNSGGNSFNYPPGYNANTDTCTTVSRIWTTVNYIANYANLNVDGCVRTSYVATSCYGSFTNDSGSNPAGPVKGCTAGQSLAATGMDHIEIQINSTGIYVYGSSYTQGSASGDYAHPYLIADAEWSKNGNPALPLTRGLTWMEDVHYNANKFDHQSLNTFEWDNYGFDGPVLPRDLAYDVPDNNQSAGSTPAMSYTNAKFPYVNLAYTVPTSGNKTFTINSVTTTNGSGGLVVFNWWPWYSFSKPNIEVSVNGNAPIPVQDTTAPAGTNGDTGAIAIPISEINNGTNTLAFTTPGNNSGVATPLANIDLIILGAGGTYSP